MTRRVYLPGIVIGGFFIAIAALCGRGMTDNYAAYRCYTDLSGKTRDERLACESGFNVFEEDCFFMALSASMGLVLVCASLCVPTRPTADEEKLERLVFRGSPPVASVV